MLKTLHYIHLLAYISVLSAMFGIYQIAFSNNVKKAILYLLLCGGCRVINNLIMRLKSDITSKQNNFGLQVDILASLIAFGVLPCLIVYNQNPSLFILPCLAFYMLAITTRLAMSIEAKTDNMQIVNAIAFILPLYQLLPLQGDWTRFIGANIILLSLSIIFIVQSIKKHCNAIKCT